MIHDPKLLEALDDLPKVSFSGEVFRATRQSLDPLLASYNGGRWMLSNAAAVLYTSLARDGALAEITFHWSQLTPRPTKLVQLHTLRVVTQRALKLVRANLEDLGVSEAAYRAINPARTKEIGAAAEFLGYDGVIAPSARWPCENLVLFVDRMPVDAALEVVSSEAVDWIQWGKARGLLA